MIQQAERICKGRNTPRNVQEWAKNGLQTGQDRTINSLQTAKEQPQKNSLNRESLLSVALELREHGLSVVPVKADKTPALSTWKQYQKRPMTEGELKRHFTSNTSSVRTSVMIPDFLHFASIPSIHVVDKLRSITSELQFHCAQAPRSSSLTPLDI